MTMICLLMNCWKKMDRLLYVTALFRPVQQRCSTLSWRRLLLYRDQSFVLLCNSMDWFLYDRDLCHERVEVYKNLSETTFCDLLVRQENTYNFPRNREFQIPRVNTVWYGSNSLTNFGPIIWDLIYSELE